uniref:Fibronectin type-III domain-containing protein n=1 Tax=Oryzias sinensis TaxID=183150 RepID=A0A8C7YNN7_9TELE
MIAVFLVCLLSWSRSSAVETELPPPQDLTMVAINTNYTLRWNYKQSAALPNQVTFTTEFISKYKLAFKKKPPVWKTACKESPEHSCELTSFDLHYFAIYTLRVRASVNGNHSAWAFKDFCPEEDSKSCGIGPPSSVKLALAGYSLEVSIVDPLTSTNSSMKDFVTDLSYNIRYWERHEDEEALIIKTISTNSNVVALSDLKPLTWYCVRVQSYTKYYNRSSSFTSPLCMKNDGETFIQLLLSLLLRTPSSSHNFVLQRRTYSYFRTMVVSMPLKIGNTGHLKSTPIIYCQAFPGVFFYYVYAVFSQNLKTSHYLGHGFCRAAGVH